MTTSDIERAAAALLPDRRERIAAWFQARALQARDRRDFALADVMSAVAEVVEGP